MFNQFSLIFLFYRIFAISELFITFKVAVHVAIHVDCILKYALTIASHFTKS